MAAVVPKKKSASQEKLQNIKVMVRVRPLSRVETEMHIRSIVKCTSQREIMAKEKKFHFDRVFAAGTDQIEVYKAVVAPMIPDIIAGYNCTVFAYGPTGSGKTYTMTGDSCACVYDWETDVVAGCIPRAAAHIFDILSEIEKFETNVKVSYLELYNEEVRDLLSDDDAVLPIFNDTKGCVFIQGLTEVSVHDGDGLCKQLQKGTTKRQTAPTLMNHQSSRSHTVFTITVHTREATYNGEDILKSGKINLVDLAGSENIARSGCKDMRAVELANINKSLLTLGRVIQALADKAPKHVPYRDSKLTRILQDSLGGHTKTAIIATISPAACSYDETISTLDYASRARDIKNTPTVNEKMTKTQMIQGLLSEIDRLQRDLDAARDKSGFYVHKENYQKLIESVELVTGEKLSVEELARKQQARIKELEEIVAIKKKTFDETVVECKKSKELLLIAKEVIKENKERLRQERYVSQALEAQAGQLHENVQQLLTTTEQLSTEKGILQQKLEKQFYINVANESTARQAVTRVLDMLKKISDDEERLKLSDLNINNLCRQEIYDLKFAIEQIVSQLKVILDAFSQTNSKDYGISDQVKETVAKFVFNMELRAGSLRRQLEQHEEILADLERKDIPEFVTKFRSITSVFVNNVYSIVTQMNEVLDAENYNVFKDVEQLQIEMKEKLANDEELYLKKKEKDLKMLEQVNKIKAKLEKNRKGKSTELIDSIISKEREMAEQIDKIVVILTRCPKKLEDLPEASIPDDFMKVATDMQQEIAVTLEEAEKTHALRMEESCTQLGTSVGENLKALEDVFDTKADLVSSRLEFLKDDRQHFEGTFKSFVKQTEEILADEFLKKVVPASHDGDTPSRKPFPVPAPVDPAPRAALIERFKQEKPIEEEDKENIPLDLNISSSSFTNLGPSDSEFGTPGCSRAPSESSPE